MKVRIFGKPVFKESIFILSVFLFLLPRPYLPDPGLDSSWQIVLEAAYFENWEFGEKINFTGGPLSLLYSPTSTGYYVFSQIFAESLVLIFALMIIFRSIRGQTVWIQVFIAMSLAVGSAVGKDSILIASLAAGSMLIIRSKSPVYSLYFYPAFFALLGLMKFSFAVLGFICVLILTVGFVLKNSRLDSAKLIGSYLIALLGIWILTGQKLSTIPGFIINSYQISQGYLWNMHLGDNPHIFYFLLFFLLFTSLPIFFACLAHKKDLNSWLILSVAAATIYLSWKAGITRSGTHLSFFIQSSLFTSILVLPLVSKRILATSWVAILFVAYLSAHIWIYPGGVRHAALLSWNFLKHNTRFVFDPLWVNESYTNLIPVIKSKYSLPKTRDHVGQASVDVLQYQHGIIFLNDLNYHPRPTVQNYHGFNSYLLNLNLTHIQKDPPDFLVSKVEQIDNRFPFIDDSLFNFEVYQNYRPVLTEKDYLLLERLNLPNTLTIAETVVDKLVNAGQNIELSDYSNHLLWLEVDYSPSILHHASAFLYKPEILRINLTLEDDSTRSYRLLGGVLDEGFLLNPLIETNEALQQFLNNHRPENNITRFNIVSESPYTPFKTKEFQTKISLVKSAENVRN